LITHLGRDKIGRFKSDKAKADHAVAQFTEKIDLIDKRMAFVEST